MKLIYKIFTTLILLIMTISNGYSFLGCVFNDAPITDFNDILVYDSDRVFKNTLSSLDYTIQEGDYLRVSFSPTTDDENNIQSQEFLILNENFIVDVNFKDYDNLNNALTGGNVFNYDDNNLVYNEIFYNSKSYYMPIDYNDGNAQDLFKLGVQMNEAGFYTLLAESTDSCGDKGFKDVNITIMPESNPTTFNCTGSLTVSQNGYYDVRIKSDCTAINIQNTASVNLNIFVDEVPLSSVDLNIDYSSLGDETSVYLFGSGVDFNLNLDGQLYYFYGNYNHFNFNLLDADVTYFSGFSNYTTMISNNSVSGDVRIIKITDFYSGYFNSNKVGVESMLVSLKSSNIDVYGTNSKNGGVVLYFNNEYAKPLGALDRDFESNVLNFVNGASLGFYIGEDTSNILDIKLNEFNNVGLVTFEMLGDYGSNDNTNNVYLNTFKSKSSTMEFEEYGQGFFIDTFTLYKEIEGKPVGNIWLDNNGNDIYECAGGTWDLNYQGKTYAVCNTPTLIHQYASAMGGGDIDFYDYIIVTDETAGGYEPIEENQRPVALIDITPLEQVVNNNIEWDISDSYDSDGSIVSKKVWVDNVLFENQDTGTITSDVPKIINFKIEVIDNEGLKHTIYRQAVFTDTTQNCIESSTPYAEIDVESLGGNQYTFSAVNVFNGGDSVDDLQYLWTINYNSIQGQAITSSVDFNQTVYLNVFNGCRDDTFFVNVNSTNVYNPNTQPIVTIDCETSSNNPPSVLTCDVEYDLRGYNLDNIIWSYNGDILTSFEDETSIEKIVNDLGQHTISVTVYSDSPAQKTEYYNFALSSLVINENDVFGCTDENAINYQSNATINDDSCVYSDNEVVNNQNELAGLFSGDMNEVGDSISSFFGTSSTPLYWAMIIGFTMLGIGFIILIFALVGVVIR